MALKYIKYILFISDRCIFLWSYVSILISLVTIITPIVVLAIPFVPAVGVLAISIPTIGIPVIPFVPTIVAVAMAVFRWLVSVVHVFTIIQRMFVVRMVPHALWMLLLHCLGFRRRGVQRGMPHVPIHGSFDVADARCVQGPSLPFINQRCMVGTC